MAFKSNELRIGNLIYWNIPEKLNVPHEVVGIVHDRPLTIPISLGDSIHEYLPIKLTEDWLLKFGLKREDKSPSKEHCQYFSMWVMDYKYSFAYAPFREDWGFYHSYTDASKDEDNNKFDFISCGIKYVHQLQNLCFALTGNELVVGAGQEKV